MSFFKEVLRKIKFDGGTDRIGPDILFTYWKLSFNNWMVDLCKREFKKFEINSKIRPGAYIVGCSQIEIGDNVVIRPEPMIHAETDAQQVTVIIKDDVLIGSGVHIYVSNHNFHDPSVSICHQGHTEGAVILERGCCIGANTIILPGVVIGENAVVGAGSVGTKSIPKQVIAVGNPAKVIKNII